MGITKATFKCDNCGKKKIVNFPTNDGRNRPRGWLLTVIGPMAIYLCTPLCREEWESCHSVGRIAADGGTGETEEEVPPIVAELRKRGIPIQRLRLSDFLEDASDILPRDIHGKMANEFGVPREIVEDFFKVLTKTSCPKCKAQPEEECHPCQGDEIQECEDHGAHLKALAHSERIAQAKIVWKGKLQ